MLITLENDYNGCITYRFGFGFACICSLDGFSSFQPNIQSGVISWLHCFPGPILGWYISPLIILAFSMGWEETKHKGTSQSVDYRCCEKIKVEKMPWDDGCGWDYCLEWVASEGSTEVMVDLLRDWGSPIRFSHFSQPYLRFSVCYYHITHFYCSKFKSFWKDQRISKLWTCFNYYYDHHYIWRGMRVPQSRSGNSVVSSVLPALCGLSSYLCLLSHFPDPGTCFS